MTGLLHRLKCDTNIYPLSTQIQACKSFEMLPSQLSFFAVCFPYIIQKLITVTLSSEWALCWLDCLFLQSHWQSHHSMRGDCVWRGSVSYATAVHDCRFEHMTAGLNELNRDYSLLPLVRGRTQEHSAQFNTHRSHETEGSHGHKTAQDLDILKNQTRPILPVVRGRAQQHKALCSTQFFFIYIFFPLDWMAHPLAHHGGRPHPWSLWHTIREHNRTRERNLYST